MSTQKTSYREAYTELETILEKLENNELDVDQLTAQVKRAAELIKFCRGKLVDTESEIEKIINEIDSGDGE
jgi:exodeoxyribonuclease VII small subunit